MNSEFAELTHTRYRKRAWRRRLYVVLGLLLIALGYMLMCVKPDTNMEWVWVRVVAGLGCIAVGFGLAVLPLLSTWTNGE
jgi:uncharacterized membrane protein